MDQNEDIYRTLQKHLNSMPVGFPKTKKGEEIQLLKALFSEQQARIAMVLDHVPKGTSDIKEQLENKGLNSENLRNELHEMSRKGGIYAIKRDGNWLYSLHHWAFGIFEQSFLAAWSENRSLDEIRALLGSMDFNKKFIMDILSSKEMFFRTIPIQESVPVEHKVATHDDLTMLIENNQGKFAIVPCVCKINNKKNGNPCKVTKRIETCLALRDYAELVLEHGFGKEISKDEALEIAAKNQDEGLVLQVENTKNPNWICACCGDCCGTLGFVKYLPRPSDFIHSNYIIQIDEEKCVGCEACIDRCPINAISISNKSAKAVLNASRCIGCGACVSSCKSDAIALVERALKMEPVETYEDYMAMLDANRKNKLQKAAMMLKIIFQMMVKN